MSNLAMKLLKMKLGRNVHDEPMPCQYTVPSMLVALTIKRAGEAGR